MTRQDRIKMVASMAATLYSTISVPAGGGGTRVQVAVDTAYRLLDLAETKCVATGGPT